MPISFNNNRYRRTAKDAWLESVDPLEGLSITQAKQIVNVSRRRGNPLLQKIYDEIEKVDPVLMTCVMRRQSALSRLGWTVKTLASAKDQTLADEQRDALDRFLSDIPNFDEAIEHLGLAFFRGLSVVQPIWESPTKVKKISLLNSWNFLEDDEGELLWNPEASLDKLRCEDMSDARAIVVRNRLAIDYPALTVYIRKALGERDWGRFIERYGIPPVDVTMAQNATEDDREKYIEAADKAKDGLSTVWPNGSNVSRAEGSRGQDPFTAFIEHQEKLIVLAATGGTLTSLAQADTGSLAGGAQMDVWREVVARDSVLISSAIRRSLCREFLEAAFPGSEIAVDFQLGKEESISAKDAADLAQTLKQAGYLVDQAELEEAVGFKLVKVEEPAQGGNPLFNKKILNKSEDVKSPILEAFSKDLSPAAEAVKELLKDPTPEKAKELLEKLPELLPEDPEMAAIIADEMAKTFASETIANKEDAQGNEHDEGNGQFTSKGGGASAAKNDGKINFGNNAKAKSQADKQSKDLGYKGVEDLLSQSTSVPQNKIDAIVAGGNFVCEPHEAVAAIRSLASIKSNVGGEVKLSERALRHYVCGERRHHGGEPDIGRLRTLPKAIDAVKHSDSRHWELDGKKVVVLPSEKPARGTQAVYCKNSGKHKTYAYADSGVLNGWQVND